MIRLLALCLLLSGCASSGFYQMSDAWCDAHADATEAQCTQVHRSRHVGDPRMSWDQANLKANDHGCPTAVFIAANGNLEQCQQTITLVLIPKTVTAPKGYDTIEEAAINGLASVAAKPTALFYEWGALIVQNAEGKFVPLPATTTFEGDHVEFGDNDMLPNATPVGSYHTHPCLPDHYVEYFSPPDLVEPLLLRRTTFMGDFCTGNVHEFKPGDKPDVEHPTAHSEIFLTKGRIVGQFTSPHPLTVAE